MRHVPLVVVLILLALGLAWLAPVPPTSEDPVRLDSTSLGSPRPAKGDEAQLWYLSRLNFPHGPVLPQQLYESILAFQEQMPNADQYQPPNGAARRLPAGPWESFGPNGAPVRGDSRRFAGRVRDLEWRESSGLRVAAATGGLWEYVDGVPVCLTDNLHPNFGAFATNPTDDDAIVVGTGEHGRFAGVGVQYTTDRGVTWNASGGGAPGGWCYDVVFAEWPNREVHVAARNGHFVSTNDGVSFGSATMGVECTSVVVDQTSPGVIYGAFRRTGIFKSVNSGAIWTPMSIPGLSADQLRRATLAISPSDPQQVWVLAETKPDSVTPAGLNILARTVDGGANWSPVAFPGDWAAGQSDYNHLISVHPTDPTRVLLGGIRLYWSDNSGASWSQSNDYHADNHCAAWNEDGSELWNGSDGGVFHSTDAGKNFTSTNNNLPITQHLMVSTCTDYPEIMIGGTQDNGVMARGYMGDWEVLVGGDGGGTVILPEACSTSLVAGGLHSGNKSWRRSRSYDFFGSYEEVEDGIDPNLNWYPSLRTAPGQNKVYTHAAEHVYVLVGPSERWSKLNPEPFDFNVLDVGVGTGTAGKVWAALDTNLVGERIKLHQAGIWYNRDLGDIPSGLIRRVVTHPYMGDRAYALLTNVGSGVSPLWRTDDAGLSWESIGDGLGGLVPEDVVPHPLNPYELFVSTSSGVVWTPNGGFSWFAFDTGLPRSLEMREMTIVRADDSSGEYWLVAATYGRGIWRRRLSAPAAAGPPDVTNSTFQVNVPDVWATPTGTGPTLASLDATITVQVSDADSLPVPGIDPSRITLHSIPSGALVNCGGPITADGPTSHIGLTTFSMALPVGGYTATVQVRIDGLPVEGGLGFPLSELLRIRSIDLNKDLATDILDFTEFAQEKKLYDDFGFVSGPVNFHLDSRIDELDLAILTSGMYDGSSTCAGAGGVNQPAQGTLGVYFEADGDVTGRIVAPGETFPLYIVVRDMPEPFLAYEFAIPALADPAIDPGVSVTYGGYLVDQALGVGEFRVSRTLGGPVPEATLIYFPAVTVLEPVEGLSFAPQPIGQSSFGTSETPGWVPDSTGALERVPFAVAEGVFINPFPGEIWDGFVVDAVADAGLLVFDGLLEVDPSQEAVSGVRLYAAGAPLPGAAGGLEGMDGVSFDFASSLPAANLPAGVQLWTDFIGPDSQPLVTVLGTVNNGVWNYAADMKSFGSSTGRLQLLVDGDVQFDLPGFAGSWALADGLPAHTAVGRLNSELVVYQGWDTPTAVTVGGQNYAVDTLLLFSETGGSAPTGAIHDVEILADGLPSFALGGAGVQRYGAFHQAVENVWFRNRPNRLEVTTRIWGDPAIVDVATVDGSAAVLRFPGPVLADEPDARVELLFQDGSGNLGLEFVNGAVVQLGGDLSGLNTSDWILRGFSGANEVWQHAGSTTEFATLERWPVLTTAIQTGVRMEFDSPTIVEPVGAAQRRRADPVTALQLEPVQPQFGVPSGEQVRITFDKMRTLAFVEGAFGVDTPPAPRVSATQLLPAVPNPFNPRTEVQFELAQAGRVKVSVYDTRGRLVRHLVDAERGAGRYREVWDGNDQSGRRVASGVYLVRMVAADGAFARKVTLVK